MSAEAENDPADNEQGTDEGEAVLNDALEATLANLQESISRMENIAERLENGEADMDESIRLLSEANELASTSSKILDKAVQDVLYGDAAEGGGEDEPERQADDDESGA